MTFNASRRESTELTQTPTSFEFESSRNTSRGAIISNSLSNRIKAVSNPKGFVLIYTARISKTSIPGDFTILNISRSISPSTRAIPTEFWQRPPAMLLVSKSARVVASHRQVVKE
jgi:hypothetical protein